jgi:hypothetical protein
VTSAEPLATVRDVHGPHIAYLDNATQEPKIILLTGEPGEHRDWWNHINDRERVLIRALLHLAQDRLDSVNPHD